MRGTVLKEIPVLYRHWVVSFDIFPMGTVNDYGNILHLSTGVPYKTYGERTPTIYFKINETNLCVSSSVNSDPNYRYCFSGQCCKLKKKFGAFKICGNFNIRKCSKLSKFSDFQNIFAIYTFIFEIFNGMPILQQ